MTNVPAGPDRLHVLVVSHMFPADDKDNYGLFIREQAEALAHFAKVSVAVGRFGESRPSVPSMSGDVTAYTVQLPASSWLPSSAVVARAVPDYIRGAREIAHRHGPVDVVHAHFGFPDGVVGVRLAKALGVPCVVTLHGDDYNRQLSRPVVGPRIGRELAAADLVIGCSAAIAEGMRDRFGLDESQSIFLPNGYNDLEIHLHADRTPKHYLFVGGLIPRKNPDILLEAYARVAERVGLDLVLVGDGPMRGELVSSAERLGVAERVCFEGQQAHARLDGYLAEAAALVLPSTSEGMPIVVNEALASGTPVIATRLPGTELQVHDSSLGTLVPVRCVDALADALLECDARAWDYARIARTSGVLSWRGYAQRLDEAYRGLLMHRGDV